MHGYELRKRLSSVLGAFHAFSYGSLYPCLKDLLVRGLIVEEDPDPGARASRPSRNPNPRTPAGQGPRGEGVSC